MATAEERGLTKLTAKLYEPMYIDFDRRLSDALLRRDAFLDRMIEQEITHLHEDLDGKRLSNEANRYISRRLKATGGERGRLRQVSIAVKPTTADALREAVEEHNLVRDAFLNRLIVFLRSSDDVLKALGLNTRVRAGRADGSEDMPTSPLRVIEETLADPLYYLRAQCHERYECGLHLLRFPEQLTGFSCYLSDDEVPSTLAFKERQKKDEKLLAELGFLEANLTQVAAREA